MISLYSGTPGSGKSLHIGRRIYYGLKRGRKIVGNFDINYDLFKKPVQYDYIDNLQLNPDILGVISREYFINKYGEKILRDGTRTGSPKRVKEDEILLVIDECQLLFNSREWQKGSRAKWLEFFTQHRKYGYEIVLVAQFDGMIDKQIRSLIEYQVIHRKVKNFGTWGFIFNTLALGGLFVEVNMWYPLGERLGAEFFKADSKIFKLYDSYKFFADPDPVGEKKGN